MSEETKSSDFLNALKQWKPIDVGWLIASMSIAIALLIVVSGYKLMFPNPHSHLSYTVQVVIIVLLAVSEVMMCTLGSFRWPKYWRNNVRGSSVYFWISRTDHTFRYTFTVPDEVSSVGLIWKYPLGGWFNRGPKLLEWRSDAYCVYGLHTAKTDWRLVHPKSSAVPVQYGKPEVIKVLLGTKDGTMALMWLPEALRWMADNPKGDFDKLFESWKVNSQSREFLQQLVEDVLARIQDTSRFRMTKEAGDLVRFIDGSLRDNFPGYRARREREEDLRPRSGGHGIKA